MRELIFCYNHTLEPSEPSVSNISELSKLQTTLGVITESSNVLLIASSWGNTTTFSEINAFISSLPDPLYHPLYNLTVFHLTRDIAHVVIDSAKCKKILNIFPFDMQICERGFELLPRSPNIKTNQRVKKSVSVKKFVKGIATKIIYGKGTSDVDCLLEPPKFEENSMITYVFSDISKSTWWREKFHNIECASGRLVQITGTCWFNTAINIALLSDIGQFVRQKLQKQFKYVERKDVEKLEKSSFKNAFLSLAKDILVTKSLVSESDGDISLILGKKIKDLMWTNFLNEATKNKEENKQNITNAKELIVEYTKEIKEFDKKIVETNEKLKTIQSIFMRIEKLLLDGESLAETVGTTLGKEIDRHKQNIKIFESNILIFQNKIANLKDNQQIANNNIAVYKKRVTSYEEKLASPKSPQFDSSVEGGNSKLGLIECLKEIDITVCNLLTDPIDANSQVVIVPPEKRAEKLDSTIYHLTACLIGSENHSISGMICNDIEYIFDSNNHIISTPWKTYIEEYNKNDTHDEKYRIKNYVYVLTSQVGSYKKKSKTRVLTSSKKSIR